MLKHSPTLLLATIAFSSCLYLCDGSGLPNSEFPIPENDANKIMHIALSIGKNLLMANDVPEHMGRTNENENKV